MLTLQEYLLHESNTFLQEFKEVEKDAPFDRKWAKSVENGNEDYDRWAKALGVPTSSEAQYDLTRIARLYQRTKDLNTAYKLGLDSLKEGASKEILRNISDITVRLMAACANAPQWYFKVKAL